MRNKNSPYATEQIAVLARYGLTPERVGWYENEITKRRTDSVILPISERRCVILARRAAP